MRPADSRAGEEECQRWARIAISANDSIRAEMSRIEVEAPKLTAHVSVSSKSGDELRASLAEKLSEYARAGVLPEAIAVIKDGAPGLDLEPIETTAAGAEKEGTAAAPTIETTPEPPL